MQDKKKQHMKNDKTDGWWYYFGKCMAYPHQIPKGHLPMPPFLRFKTERECQKHIDSGQGFNVMKRMKEQSI